MVLIKESEQTEEEPVKSKIKPFLERSKSDSKDPTQLKQIDLNETTKPFWIKLSKSDFASLIKDVVNNLDNNDYQTKINNDNYDLKKAHKLYENLIKPKVDKLEMQRIRVKIRNQYFKYFRKYRIEYFWRYLCSLLW